jgi:hypothetical protein
VHKTFGLEKTKENGYFEGPGVGVQMNLIINKCGGSVWTGF